MNFTANCSRGTVQCCICGCNILEQYSNNPWPLRPSGRCCCLCNDTKVIPARLRIWDRKSNPTSV